MCSDYTGIGPACGVMRRSKGWKRVPAWALCAVLNRPRSAMEARVHRGALIVATRAHLLSLQACRAQGFRIGWPDLESGGGGRGQARHRQPMVRRRLASQLRVGLCPDRRA